jgi:CheY-like chemotaxis protein
MGYLQKKMLCVDDDEDDRFFLAEAINEIDPNVSIIAAQNGLEALDYLNMAKQNGEGLPRLIVLDINMPYLDGKRTLQHIKEDPQLNHIPIVVFTNSADPADATLFESYGIQMITKPDNIAYLQEIAGHLVTYIG